MWRLVLGIVSENLQMYVAVSELADSLDDRMVIGQFKHPSVQRYLHDLTPTLGEYMEELTSGLTMFKDIGVYRHHHTVRLAPSFDIRNTCYLLSAATGRS